MMRWMGDGLGLATRFVSLSVQCVVWSRVASCSVGEPASACGRAAAVLGHSKLGFPSCQ
jgi:hypothetical protein